MMVRETVIFDLELDLPPAHAFQHHDAKDPSKSSVLSLSMPHRETSRLNTDHELLLRAKGPVHGAG